MKTLLLAAATVIAVSASPALAQTSTTTTQAASASEAAMPTSPQDFAAMATSSNMLEIESSRLALQNAQSDEVKQFAQHMIDDHTKAAQEMMPAAQQDGVSEMPTEMMGKHQAKMTELSSASTENFDAAYVALQVEAHEEAVALFDHYSDQDGALADFAEATLPTLQEHLQEVQKLQQQ